MTNSTTTMDCQAFDNINNDNCTHGLHNSQYRQLPHIHGIFSETHTYDFLTSHRSDVNTQWAYLLFIL